MSRPRYVDAEGGDRYRATTVMNIDVQLDPGVGIRVSLPYLTASGGAMPFVVRLGVSAAIHADREQLVRLRDVITAALDAEGGESE